MRNPWEIDWSDPAQARQATQRPRIQGPARQPAPQTADQAARDALGVTQGQQDVLYTPQREARDVAAADRANREEVRGVDQRNFENLRNLRDQFNGLREVSTYGSVMPMFGSAVRAADNPVGDMQIITAWVKTYDPTGSVMSGDVATAEQSQSMIQRIQATPSYWTGDGRLRPEVRRNFLMEIRNRAANLGQSYNRVRGDYITRARRAGMNPADIVGTHPGEPFRDEEEALLGRRVGDRRVPGEVDTPRTERPQGRAGWYTDAGGLNGDTLEVNVTGGRLPQNLGEAPPETRADYARAKQRNPGLTFEQFIAGFRGDISVSPQQQLEMRRRLEGTGGAGDLLLHGATWGLSDEAAGVGNAAYNMITAPFMEGRNFDPIAAYRAGNRAEDMYLDEARSNTGAIGTGAEILGTFAGGRPSLGPIGGGPGGRTLWNNPVLPTLGGRARQGAGVGGATGGVIGFGQGEGAQDSLLGAGGGLGVGATLGAGIPLLAAGGASAARSASALIPSRTPPPTVMPTLSAAATPAVRRDPGVAPRLVADAVAADANTARNIFAQMREAQELGVPYMLADSGDNVRGLLAASTRAPGPARTLARDALEQRQEGFADRVIGAIQHDLGPTPNIDDVADELLTQASTAASPLYEAAYARPGADAFWQRISGLANRPSMRAAMSRARALAAEEGRDPTALGFDLDEVGEVVLTRVPSWQTMDYVKRGLDDVVETYRDATTGRLNLDTQGRATNSTLRTFLREFDAANPEYAAARAAYAGPVRARSAMEAGRRALISAPDDIHRATRDLSPSELDFYRTGVRRAMVDMVSRRGDTADVTLALRGTPARRAVLSRLFGGKQEFERFIRTLDFEREGYQTFRRATQGSPTAQNLQDDSSLASAIPTAMIDMTTTGLPVATGAKRGLEFLARNAGNKTREELAALLSETDPTRLANFGRELLREAAKRRAAARQAARRSSAYGVTAGQVGGQAGATIPQ